MSSSTDDEEALPPKIHSSLESKGDSDSDSDSKGESKGDSKGKGEGDDEKENDYPRNALIHVHARPLSLLNSMKQDNGTSGVLSLGGCQATAQFFTNILAPSAFLDHNWQCRKCGLYAIDHPLKHEN
jgi:hypothetical protein